MDGELVWQAFGAFCFGVVVGWITYRTLRRRTDAPTLGDLANLLGAVAGAAVTSLYQDPNLFAAYSVGLLVGLFGYLVAAMKLAKGGREPPWMEKGPDPPHTR